MRRLLAALLCKAFHTGTYTESDCWQDGRVFYERVVVRVCGTCGRNLL